jgi:catechol 2,3-dioxygenase-like lactoylglutathione lyase family enzyme
MTAKTHLSYVALALDDVAAAQAVLTDGLGMVRGHTLSHGQPVSTVLAGNIALVLFERTDPRLGQNTPRGVHHLGFVADEPEQLLEHAALGSTDHFEHGIGGPQWAVDAARTAGASIRLGTNFAHTINGDPTPGHPLIERIDHIGIASGDNRTAESIYTNGLGLPVESRQTDMEVRTVVESFTSDRYGVVYHAREPEPVGGLRVTFITAGECELEFLEEVDTQAMSGSRSAALGHKAGTTRQDQGAVGRFIERRGPGLHHLAFKTPNINSALDQLREVGVRTIDQVGRPGSRRAQIGFIHPSATGGVLVHLVEREPL